MGIFDRIRNGFRGRVEQTIEKLEQDNPDAVYSAAIESTKASVIDHREAVAAMMQQRTRLTERVTQMEREAASVIAALNEAVDEGDDDTALVLQMRKIELEEQLESTRADLAQLTEQLDTAKQAMVSLKDGAKQLERERDRKLAQLAAAEATIAVQEANSGLSEEPAARALGSVRESIDRLSSRAGLDDGVTNKALGKASDLAARAQLEELKKKHKKPGGDGGAP
jgi:phage shock protein A